MRFWKILVAIISLCIFFSCKKDKEGAASRDELQGEWRWVAQYMGAPANTLTPQNTGIEETLIFYGGNKWSVMQNNVLVNSGSYRVTIDDVNSKKVKNLHYSNSRRGDSTAYYSIVDNILFFSNDLSGTVGANARRYAQK